MKLAELVEQNFQNDIQAYDPSGNSSPTPVDPEKLQSDRVEKNDSENRAMRLRKRWKTVKDLRKAPSSGVRGMSDSEDLSPSGANSVMNGPFK